MKRIFLRLDTETVPQSLTNRLDGGGGSFGGVDTTIGMYSFSFDEAVFDHALLLMGKDPTRFGFNVSRYICSTAFFFVHVPEQQYVQMIDGDTDFKRRYSEDLGVAVGCLFMVESLGLKWETITHILNDSKLKRKRPDFIGFDSAGAKHLFETKGTTQPDKVSESLNEAKAQLEEFREPTASKYAIASYFALGHRSLPSFCFVADPPTSPNLIDEGFARRLHLLVVLEFIGFQRTLEALRSRLAAQHREKENPDRPDMRYRHRNVRDFELSDILGQDTQAAARVVFRERPFVGQMLKAECNGSTFNIFLGADEELLRDEVLSWQDTERVRRTLEALPPVNNTAGEANGMLYSLFSDGTLFTIQERI